MYEIIISKIQKSVRFKLIKKNIIYFYKQNFYATKIKQKCKRSNSLESQLQKIWHED